MIEKEESPKPTIEALLERLKQLFAQTETAPVQSEHIRKAKEMFENHLNNGDTASLEKLFGHSLRLMSELDRIGQIGLFQ